MPRTGLVVSLALVAALARATAAQDFNVDVGLPGSQPPATYAAAGQAGVWNSTLSAHTPPFTPGPTPSDDMLVDIHGNPTGVGFHQFGGMDLYTVVDPSVSGDDAALLNDYLATHSPSLATCPYLNGLENGTYEVLTYAWMPNNPATLQKVNFDGHPGQTFIGGAWTGGHVEGITYSRDIITVTTGHIGWHIGIPSGGATHPGAAFAGFQIRKIDSAWNDLGQGLAGVGGTPQLSGSGTLLPGDPVFLDLTNARKNAVAYFVIGAGSVNLPFYGGTLVPHFEAPLGLFVVLTTDGVGELHLASTWPGGLPPGFSMVFQSWIDDPGGPFGFTASNALEAVTP